jgi:diaminopimelate decarboxylase
VTTVKPTPYDRTYLGVDTGFHHLVRPTMYGSYHHISNLTAGGSPAPSSTSAEGGRERPYLVAGLICESGDVFTRGEDEAGHNVAAPRTLPETAVGDVLVLHTAGAYGYAMASEYNMRPRPAELTLQPASSSDAAGGAGGVGGELTVHVARKAVTVADLVAAALCG